MWLSRYLVPLQQPGVSIWSSWPMLHSQHFQLTNGYVSNVQVAIPLDIMTVVIDMLGETHDTESRLALISCSQTCKSLVAFCQMHLFKRISLCPISSIKELTSVQTVSKGRQNQQWWHAIYPSTFRSRAKKMDWEVRMARNEWNGAVRYVSYLRALSFPLWLILTNSGVFWKSVGDAMNHAGESFYRAKNTTQGCVEVIFKKYA